MVAYSVSWGAHKGNHNIADVRFEALDDSMAVDKAIEHSAGEQTATNLPCVLIATRTLAWKRSNERKFSYSR